MPEIHAGRTGKSEGNLPLCIFRSPGRKEFSRIAVRGSLNLLDEKKVFVEHTQRIYTHTRDIM